MRGLALAGGGARGAYHIGVVKAYIESGYEFDGYVGTSIGAINAAILAQGDFDKAEELWQNISMEQIFSIEESRLITLGETKFDIHLSADLTKGIKKVIKGKGVDTTKIKAFFETYIDETKIRQSGKDYGLVTVSIDEYKPYEIFLEDIPEGKLINYIMASSSLPGLKSEVIGEKKFLDGGFYNNFPINLLVDKGYDEIIAIRTGAPGIFRKVNKNANVKIIIISTEEVLGDLLVFSPENSRFNIKLGYYDGMRAIKGLQGRQYYVNVQNRDALYRPIMSMTDKHIEQLEEILEPAKLPFKRSLFEHIIPQLGAYLKLDKDFDYPDFVIALLEYAAKQREIERFALYTYDEFFQLIKANPLPEKEDSLLGILFSSKKEKAVEAFIEILLSL